jgi:hypothetical protein
MFLGAAILAGLWFTQETWRPWLIAEEPTPAGEGPDHDHAEDRDRVKLTPQAKANLRLVVKPIALRKEYWRTILIPGQIGSSPGAAIGRCGGRWRCRRDRGGAGDTVRPGGELFTLRLNSESLQNAQTELFKTAQEVKIAQKQYRMIEGSVRSGALSEQKLLDLQFQLDRLAAARKAYRTDLTTRGLTPEQIDLVEEGTFVRQTTIRAPLESGADVLFEVEELKVQSGEQVRRADALLAG